MYLLKWINENDGDFFATVERLEDAEGRAREAWRNGEIDQDDTVQVFEAAMSPEERDDYAEPVAEYSA